MVANKKTTQGNISRQFLFLHYEIIQISLILSLIAVLDFTFCQFLDKNCLEIFSNVVFLLVTVCGYPAMMPISQTDFMILTDTSNVMCTRH